LPSCFWPAPTAEAVPADLPRWAGVTAKGFRPARRQHKKADNSPRRGLWQASPTSRKMAFRSHLQCGQYSFRLSLSSLRVPRQRIKSEFAVLEHAFRFAWQSSKVREYGVALEEQDARLRREGSALLSAGEVTLPDSHRSFANNCTLMFYIAHKCSVLLTSHHTRLSTKVSITICAYNL
jgi:hypothetical protein